MPARPPALTSELVVGDLRLFPCPGVNVVVGPDGAGKERLLDLARARLAPLNDDGRFGSFGVGPSASRFAPGSSLCVSSAGDAEKLAARLEMLLAEAGARSACAAAVFLDHPSARLDGAATARLAAAIGAAAVRGAQLWVATVDYRLVCGIDLLSLDPADLCFHAVEPGDDGRPRVASAAAWSELPSTEIGRALDALLNAAGPGGPSASRGR